MKRRLILLSGLLFGALLLYGLVAPGLGSQPFDTILEDGDMAASITGYAVFLDAHGDPVSGQSLVQGAFTAYDTPVSSLGIWYNWTASGTDVDWSTFTLTVTPRFSVYATGLGPYPGSPRTLTVVTLSGRDGSGALILDLQTEAVDWVGVAYLNEYGGAGVTVRVDLVFQASASSLYGQAMSASDTVTIQGGLTWARSSLTLSTGGSSGVTLEPANFMGGVGSPVSLVALGATGLAGVSLVYLHDRRRR